MDCKETQSNIIPFIEGHLTEAQDQAFIEHIEHCEDCRDELEVYYIVIVGTRQLDEEHHMIVDFAGDLKRYIDKKKEAIARVRSKGVRRRVFFAAVSASVILAAAGAWYAISHYPDNTSRVIRKAADILPVSMTFPQGARIYLGEDPETVQYLTRTLSMPERIELPKNTNTTQDRSVIFFGEDLYEPEAYDAAGRPIRSHPVHRPKNQTEENKGEDTDEQSIAD